VAVWLLNHTSRTAAWCRGWNALKRAGQWGAAKRKRFPGGSGPRIKEEGIVQLTTSHRIRVALALGIVALAPHAAFSQAPASVSDTPGAASVESSIDNEWRHWTSGRYRLTPGDVLEFRFPFVSDLNQTVTVQPDGFISLKDVPDVKVQGRTLAQVKEDVLAAYTPFVREPEFTVGLMQFEKPYFVVNGEIGTPGRHELRGATTLTQAIAFAGGTKSGANLSQVLLLRRTGDNVEVKEINVGRMFAKKDLAEDPLLRPGDMIVVPKSVLGKLSPLLSVLRWGI
jgi:polysaccharide export outer membrane protein